MRKIVFFVGESGCGKTYLQNLLMKFLPDTYTRIISTTTRPAREGEEDGISYHFVNRLQFANYRCDLKLLQEVEYGGTNYGTQLSEYQQKQPVGIFVCTPEGIMDTIRALNNKPEKEYEFDFQIVYFMATKNLLMKHNIDEERIARGNITENFTKRYYDNEFEGIPLTIVTADQVDNSLVNYIAPKIF